MNNLTTATLHQLFDYDPTTGNLIYRKNQRGRGSKKAGDTAGTSSNKNRPDSTKVVMIKGSRYYIHRLIWVWHGNELPSKEDGLIISFKNGNKYDSRIENLMVASKNQTIIDGFKRNEQNRLDELRKTPEQMPTWLQ